MDHRASSNVSEVMDLQTKISILKNEKQRLATNIATWMVEFDVDVEKVNGTEYQIVITGKSGTKGFRKIIDQKTALYLMADKHDITKDMADEFLLSIVGPAAYDSLLPKLSQALDNLNMLAESKGFAK